MNNEIKNERNRSKVGRKIALMLTTIISLQEQIQSIRCKLCGYTSFSPQLYYKQIDKHQKGYIDLEDFTTFIKKSKPLFNIDHRYLKQLFGKFNQTESNQNGKLTYFGYLNIIKPYFDAAAARDLLLRDSISMGSQLNFAVKKLFEDLLCNIYICIAQHERLKENIMFGDIEGGGVDSGFFANIYQFYDIILRDGDNIQKNYGATIRNVVSSGAIISQTSLENIQLRSDRSLKSLQHISLKSSIHSISNNLRVFYNFIVLNSQYEVDQSDMKYLLSHLMCPQYLLTNQKYLTTLFMPVTGSISLDNSLAVVEKQKIERRSEKEGSNFLKFVHPNSISKQQLQRKKVGENADINRKMQDKNEKYRSMERSKGERVGKVGQDRALVSGSESNIKTPILQRFMRESKVLKNMSRYNYNNKQKTINEQEQELKESAFINQSKYEEEFLIGKQHKQKPIKKDINLQQVLNSSKFDQSQYYHHNLQKDILENYQRTQREGNKRDSLTYEEDYQILNNFIRK